MQGARPQIIGDKYDLETGLLGLFDGFLDCFQIRFVLLVDGDDRRVQVLCMGAVQDADDIREFKTAPCLAEFPFQIVNQKLEIFQIARYGAGHNLRWLGGLFLVAHKAELFKLLFF